MPATLGTIRPILNIADICELLRISERTFHRLKARGFFEEHNLLQQVDLDIDRNPRYWGEPFERLFASKARLRALNARLKEAAAS